MIVLVLLVACDSGPRSSKGFSLPDGDVAAGQANFVELGCTACHTVEGTEFPGEPATRAIEVRLGGKVHKVRTYGQLVTAIVHPSHDLARGYDEEVVSKDGESLMANFNDIMTIQQLIDLVAFLQSRYIEYLPKTYEPYFPATG